VFHELFTGWPPFGGKPFEMVNQIQTTDPTPLSNLADLLSELDNVLLTALAAEKADRYETVVYLRDSLRDLFETY
jgi:hypothetical protein